MDDIRVNDIKLSEKDIKEAKERKHCPFCKGIDFFATFCPAGRGFCFDKKGNIEWGEHDEEEVEAVDCNICGEEVPSKIWKEWLGQAF